MSIAFIPGAGKALDEFRVYKGDNSAWDAGVREHYRQMRLYQTVDFVDKMETVLYKFDHARMTIREAADHLSKYVDRSDPDITLPNIEHLLQTAERARAAGKPDWFQLTCLIHDLGKVVFLWGTPEDGMACASDGPQWAVGGDTFVVGCRIPDSTVYPEFNELNPDMKDPRYTSENGVYSPGCGIMNLRFAAGHDEYMYRFLLQNNPPLAAFPEALAIIRLHSCYPWHKGGAYRQFHKSDGSDDALLEAVRDFNQFDLYSKSDERPNLEKLWPYYQGLIDKYLPGELMW